MEFKKIDDKKFQCLLFEEDLEENNISLDDFFRNDTEKIHGLLDVVMEEARKEIGIAPSGEMISLQLAPQPNNSLLLTVSSGGDDISDMLRQAGKRAAKALSSMSPKENNIIKNSDDRRKKKVKEAEFESVAVKDGDEFFAIDCEGGFVDSELAICRFSEWAEFERFCSQSRRTWGVRNTLYKDNTDVYIVLERGRCSTVKFSRLVNDMLEYGEFVPANVEKIGYIKEHYHKIIADNAINITKKYCNAG